MSARKEPPCHAEPKRFEAGIPINRLAVWCRVQGDACTALLAGARFSGEGQRAAEPTASSSWSDAHVVDTAGLVIDVEDDVTDGLRPVTGDEVMDIPTNDRFVAA